MIYISLILFCLFALVLYLVKTDKVSKLDLVVYNKIKFKEYKTAFLKFITFLSDAKFVFFCCLILILIYHNIIILYLVINMIITWLIVEISKRIIKRQRPDTKRLVKINGFSFPSGHALTAITFYGYIIWLLLQRVTNLNWLWLFLLLVLIFLIAYSRIYLGVHYFSDVIGGLLLGSSYLLMYIYLTHIIINVI